MGLVRLFPLGAGGIQAVPPNILEAFRWDMLREKTTSLTRYEKKNIVIGNKIIMIRNKQRLYAPLILFGDGILLFRTVLMLIQGYLTILVPWVAGLLILEFLLNLATIISAARWWISGSARHASLPLRLIAAAIILHAFRVLIYVVGRVGPWIDFDQRPELRGLHYAGGSMFWVVFAAVMSIIGVLGVITVWQIRRRSFSR